MSGPHSPEKEITFQVEASDPPFDTTNEMPVILARSERVRRRVELGLGPSLPSQRESPSDASVEKEA